MHFADRFPILDLRQINASADDIGQVGPEFFERFFGNLDASPGLFCRISGTHCFPLGTQRGGAGNGDDLPDTNRP